MKQYIYETIHISEAQKCYLVKTFLAEPMSANRTKRDIFSYNIFQNRNATDKNFFFYIRIP